MVVTAHARYLTAIAFGYVAGAGAFSKLPEPQWRTDGPLPVGLGRLMFAFLLPTAAAVTYALLRRLSIRDHIRDGGGAFAATFDAIVFWIVLFVIGLHTLVLAGLLGAQGFAARLALVLLGLALVGVGNLLPRVAPVVAISPTYVVLVVLGQSVMRLVAGPARGAR